MGDSEDHLWKVIEPYVTAENIELDDLEVLGHGGATIVRVTVDGDEPVGVDHIARLSRGVARLLDDEDPFPGSYTLEVSSPGLERKLRRLRHFEKAIERLVEVKTFEVVDGVRKHRGVLLEADEDGFTIDADGTSRRFAHREVSSARTVFEWGAGARPGKGRDNQNRGTA